MRDGGVLGFASHHMYVYTDLNKTEELPGLLKGADLLVYMVAKSLGLSVIVKPVVKNELWSREQILLKSFHNVKRCESDEYQTENDRFKNVFGSGSGHHAKHITWCQTLKHSEFWQAAGFAGYYGNDPSSASAAYYQTAAIFVGVPEWGQYRKRSCGIQETSEGDFEGLAPGEGERPTKRHCTSSNTQESSEAVLNKLCFHGKMPEEDWW